MGRFRTLVIASAVLMLLVSSGHAAGPSTRSSVSYMPLVSRDYAPRNEILAGRYLRADVGERSGFITAADAPSGCMTFKNLGGHEVQIGLRWNFDDLARI
jgi:hypothetical protein